MIVKYAAIVLPKFFFNTLIFLLYLTGVVLQSEAIAGEYNVFGPHTYIRESGSPVVETDNFTSTNPGNSFHIRVFNSGLEDDTYEYVSSSYIKINDIDILSPNELNQNVAFIEKQVTLEQLNTLSVELRGKPGGALSISIVGINNDLVAQAGIDQAVFAGDVVTLDGSSSYDASGGRISYQWTIISQPPESTVTLQNDNTATPIFTPIIAGAYQIQLTINSIETNVQATDQVTVHVSEGNTAPVAHAGVDQAGFIGDLITLDGSASKDVNGDNLNWLWSLTQFPLNSTVTLSNTTIINPTFTADVAGTYEAQLIVNDGVDDSLPDTVSILIEQPNTAPIANAGPDISAFNQELVQLDGSGSTDIDGDILSWHWTITTAPAGSLAMLSNDMAVNPTFTPDLTGQYIIQLVVNDSKVDSQPDSVIVNAITPNTLPISNAGADQSAYVGDLINLDGSASSDADSDPLSYNWSLIGTPTGSTAVLDNPALIDPSFTLDLPGDYIVQLIVNDGQANSMPDETIITTLNSRPIGDAGSDQIIVIGQNVQLDGSASSDADNNLITYLWSITAQPTGSTAALSDPFSAMPSFIADEIGFYVFQLIVNDGILDSAPATVTLQVVEPLQISLDAPQDQLYTNQVDMQFVGSLNHAASLTLNGYPMSVENDFTFNHTVTLQEGTNSFTLIASDDLNQQHTVTRTVTLDTSIPTIPNYKFITVSEPDVNNIVTINATEGSVESLSEVVITNLRTGEIVIVTADSNGAFSVQITGGLGDSYNIFSQDAVGNQSETININDGTVPLDPANIASPLDATQSTSILVATEFLYSGTNPIQTGVLPNTIELKRSAVMRGMVKDKLGQGLSAVTISINGHPEYGQTLTRNDGYFDIAVNGGGLLTLNYSKDGYLPVQRKINVPWNDYVVSDDVVMVPLDTNVTTINLNDSSQAFQSAQSSPVTDADGTRQATILFPQGTHASMTLADGTTQDLTTLNVRATEYTVGENGPQAMPGELPSQSAYTYAVELSVDEAIAAGATRVDFDRPVWVYVDNFLGFPAGEIVPAGWYDHEKVTWIPSDNGRIITILAITNGLVELDVDGSGIAADTTALAALGITNAERAQLASLYIAGNSLWRVPVSHFTPWDFNWPFAPPLDSTPPPPPPIPDPDLPPPDDNEDCEEGCIIQPLSQSLGEKLPITGTSLYLHYQSERMAGNVTARTMNIPLSGATTPNSLQGIDLTITVAGQVIRRSFPPTPNQSYRFVWDGRDAYGRPVARSVASIRLNYRYPVAYYSAPKDFKSAFARASGANTSFLGSRITSTVAISQQWQQALTGIAQVANLASSALGGWGLDIHHAYDANSKTLFLGDGSIRLAQDMARVITTVAGTGSPFDHLGDGGPADQAMLNRPHGVAPAPDGSFYIADSNNMRIRHVTPDGIITTVAGTGTSGYSGDGGPANQATLNFPQGITLGTDGSLYIVDIYNHCIRRVTPDGIITTIAGTGVSGYSGDGGPADQAMLSYPRDIALDSDGSLYIADTSNSRIRRIAPDGIITTVAGTGAIGTYSGDGGPADQARLSSPRGVALGSDGSLYIADTNNSRIHRVTPDGIITTVAGTGLRGYSGDGGPADQAMLKYPGDIALGSDDSLYITSDLDNASYGIFTHRIRRVAPDGIITTVVGTDVSGYSGDGGPADQAELRSPRDIALGPDGSLYIADYDNGRIRRIAPVQPGVGDSDHLIPSSNGMQLYHFNPSGRHLRTLDTTTSTVLYQFRYDADGHLIEIEDVNGDITRIERSGAVATAAVATDGQRTSLAVDANGYLNKVTDPAAQFWQMSYTASGLMTAFTDRNANSNYFNYDADGRLLRDLNPASGGWQLARTEQENGYSVTMTSGEGRTSGYQVEYLPGDIRRQTASAFDGSTTVMEFNKTLTTTTYADGTIARVTEGPDPRFSMHSPVDANSTLQTPSGLSRVTSIERTATLSNENDLLSTIALTETNTTNGRNSTSQYDAANLTWVNTSAANRSSIVQLSSKGQPVLNQITGLEQASYSYDIRGRLKAVIEGTGLNERRTTLAYYQTGPMAGYLQSITNAETQTTTFEYDAVGRVTKQIMPDNREISYSYDANGNLITLTPPGRPAHVYLYDEVDQATQYTPPSITGIDTPQTLYTYNLDKDLTQVTRPDGQTVSLNYGSITGKLDSMTIPSGNYSYSYNTTSGQLSSITSPDNGVLSLSYDGFLTTSTSWTGAVAGSIDRVYDNDFRIAARSINGANTINFQYDNDSLLIQAGSLSIGREAQKAGIINGTTLGNLTTTRTYSGFAELATFDASYNTGSLFNTSYSRDKLGRITQKVETISGVTLTTDYVYDFSGRLISETTNGTTTSYSYDANGNRTHINGTIVGVYDDQDRLTSYAGSTYQYTDNGELLRKIEAGQTTSYQYDVLGNLRQATLPDTTVIDYVIDGQDRRIGKKVNGVLVQGFLYKDQLNPIAELDGNNQIVSRFIYGTRVNVPDYMVKGATSYRIISDHLGSPRLVIDIATGSIVQRIDYDTWGNITADSNPGFQPFGFAGGLYDQHTQLTQFGFRDYDAWAGRWMAKDPIQFGGGDSNLYGYVLGDPVNLFDPTGLILCSVLENLGDVTIDLDAGIGLGLGVSGGLSLSSSGITGNVTVGSGIGLGASAGVSGTANISGTTSSGGVGTAVTVSGGAGFGGSGTINAGTGGVTATGTFGVGFGFNITSGFTGFGQILECEEEPDCGQ